MSRALTVELWAQQGIDNLCAPYRAVTVAADVLGVRDGQLILGEPYDVPLPTIDLAEALMLMRAAYAQGYGHALEDPEPDAMGAASRARMLALMLPP